MIIKNIVLLPMILVGWLRKVQPAREENNFLFPALTSTSSVTVGGKLERKIYAPTLKGEIFLNCKGWKIVYLIVKISEMKQTNPSRTSFADYVCAQDDIGSRNTWTRDGFCAAE